MPKATGPERLQRAATSRATAGPAPRVVLFAAARTRLPLAFLLLASVLTVLPSQVFAQQGTIRGLVVDEQTSPLPDVTVELRFKGTDGVPPKTVRSKTNRRGYFVRVGLSPGPYELVFSKDGYATQVVEMHLSSGDLSEIPDVILRAARADAGPPPGSGGGVDFSAVHTQLKGAEAKKVIDAFGKAVEAARAGDLATARTLYEDVVSQAPEFAAAHYNLGQVCRRQQDWARAEEAFARAIALEPDVSDGYVALAAVHEAQGLEDRALEVLATAAPRFENDARFQHNLGISYLNAGRMADAETAFTRAQAIDPANPEVHYYLGTLAIGRNELDRAVEHLERYVSGSGQNPQNLATAKTLLDTLRSQR
jgi:Tfp pilus assembly protein PilF